MTEDEEFPKAESTPRPRVVKSYGKKPIVKAQDDQVINAIPTTISVKDCITNIVPQPIQSKPQPHSRSKYFIMHADLFSTYIVN